MFPRLVKLISKLVPQRISHRWNGHKVVAALAAFAIVMALMPIPKDLRSIFASPPSNVLDGDIIVDNAIDDPLAVLSGNCSFYSISYTATGICTLRDAVALAAVTPGANRIVFDDTITTIGLREPMSIIDSELTIEGTISDTTHAPLVIIEPGVTFDDTLEAVPHSVCTNTDQGTLPLFHIQGDGNVITNLSFVNSSGNGIQIVDGNDNFIGDNWIGTSDRGAKELSGNGMHGICIATATSTAHANTINGNIIVASGNDGIRVEGVYSDPLDPLASPRLTATGTIIINNLIGNLSGDDVRSDDGDYSPGNAHSGITLKIADNTDITHNIITNNGFTDSFLGDGITLLEANNNHITDNFIGTTQTFPDAQLGGMFPFLRVEDGTFIGTWSTHPAAFGDYRAAANACDGIAIRFYEHLSTDPTLAPNACPDADMFLPSTQETVATTIPSETASLIGPSVHNIITTNDIAFNQRNGVFIQSLACNISNAAGVRHNLPNILINDSGDVVFIQSVKNTIIQNSIFANDSGTGSAVITSAESYGLGIDLEDFASATLDHAALTDFLLTYWSSQLPSDPELQQLNCSAASDVPAWQPNQPSNTGLDYNITENDGYPDDAMVGDDPDAGANRLQNFPIINSAESTITNITGTAPEGTLVELYQVSCSSGDASDVTPITASGARVDCDTDYWDEPVDGEITDIHTLGHGQGFRFLGNTHVPLDTGDADNYGTWSINPVDFFAADDSSGVSAFNGGLVVATATALEAYCWDNGLASACDATIGAASIEGFDIGAQRAGSSGSGGIWLPEGVSSSCFVGLVSSYPVNVQLISGFDPDCLGSTSEFSAAAVISHPTYSVVKARTAPLTDTVAPGDTVSYTILVSNTSNNVLHLNPSSIRDQLSTSLTLLSDVDDPLVGCMWVKTTDGGLPAGPASCSGSGPDLLSATDFGTLNPGGVLQILIDARVNSGLSGAACEITNTVKVNDLLDINTRIVDDYDNVATEVGSVDADHTAAPVTVTPCSGSSLEKQVSVGSGAYFDADSDAGVVSANRGQSVNYLLHFTNNTSSATGVTLTDTFPSALALNAALNVVCWTNDVARDSDPTNDVATTLADCRYSGNHFYADGGVTPFTVGAGDTLHVRVIGYTVNTNYPMNNNALCNTAAVSLPDGSSFSDSACVHIFDPALSVYKSVSIAGGTESSFNATSSSATWSTGSVGQSVRYYIDVANTGTGAALNGLTVTDTFPSSLGATGWECAAVTASGSISTSIDHSLITSYVSGACSVNTTTGVITTSTSLPQSSVLRIRLIGRNVPDLTAGSPLCNAVSASASVAGSASDSACIRLSAAGLQLTKTVSSATPAPGASVTYTLTVVNTGTATANDVVVTDDLDAVDNNLIPTCVASFSSVTALNGGVKSVATTGDTANRITWTLGSIAAGTTQVVTFTALIRSDIATSTVCHNIATVASSNVTSDDGSVDITVPAATVSGALISITKTATNDTGDSTSPDVFSLGDAINYRVTLQNTGDRPAANLTVRDSIPAAEEDLRNVTASNGTINTSAVSADQLEVTAIGVAANNSTTIDYTASLLDDSSFPLRSYRLSRDADRDDEQFYPDRVRNANIATDSVHSDAESALAAPDNNYVSLGEDGDLTFDLSSRRSGASKLIVDGDGNDFCVLELDNTEDTDTTGERYTVEVSQTTRNGDFERVGRSGSNSNCFDLEDANMSWARYVRIIDNSSSVGGQAPGVDVDAVCLLNLGGFVTNTAGVYDGETLLGTVDHQVLVNFTDAFENPLRARDCRSTQPFLAAAPLPPPPPAPIQLPVYVPPYVPVQLPKTGPLEAGMPAIGGASGMVAMWWMWVRRRIQK